MKNLALIAALALAGCTTEQMVTASADECAQIGYADGSTEHAQCTERGFRTKSATQDAAIGTAATTAAWIVLVDALL